MSGAVQERSAPAGTLDSAGTDVQIERQIRLPWSKAVEISFNSVKTRFVRSIITAGGVVLAITFLMATLASSEIIKAVKNGLPGILKTERAKLSQSVKSQTLEKIQAEIKAGKPLEKVRQELKRSEFKRARDFLEKETNNQPGWAGEARIQAIQADLDALLAASLRFGMYEKLRLNLLRRGEVVATGEEREHGSNGAAEGAVSEEKAEADARDRWLIALALLVALVGITNAMLMSVTERFREIGTMKCLGALDNFIVKLFLIESSMQGFLGTFFGVVLGLVMSFCKLYWDFDGIGIFLPWEALGYWVLVSLGCGTGLAVLGALYPAYVAAKMEPVVAMRVDQ